MFDMEIRADGLHISGYVNAVGRDSRPVVVPERGLVVEQIAPGAFAESLRSYKDVKIKLDHFKPLGGIMDGNLNLSEDTIGLRAETVITDPEVIESAERGELRGWSFGFINPKCKYEERADGLLPRRIVEGLTLREVSIIDSRQRPCYVGTSIEYRSDNGEDYDVVEYRESPEEFRFNPYHDPSNGRFTSGGGGAGRYVMVADHAGRTEVGRKFNGGYVDTDTDKIFEEYQPDTKAYEFEPLPYKSYAMGGAYATAEEKKQKAKTVSDFMAKARSGDVYRTGNGIGSAGADFEIVDYNRSPNKLGLKWVNSNSRPVAMSRTNVTSFIQNGAKRTKSSNYVQMSFSDFRSEKSTDNICSYCGTFLANIPVINRAANILDDVDMPCPECGRLMTVHDLCTAAFRRSEELRFNPYHDPSNGRFTSGGGGGGDYIFVVPKGQAHKGVLVKNANIDDKETASQYYHAVYENSNVNDEKHRLINGTNQYATNTYNESIEGQKFGVQGGAGTAYTLVTVDGENKLIRNDYLSISPDGRVLISDKSLAQPHEFKDTGIDYANAPHSYAPASIAGASKGNAMSFDDADNGRANPNYNKGTYGYTHNCQTCVVVHEARMRGYDVEARAKTTAVARDLSYDTTLAWIDPATGKKPSMTHISSGQDYGTTLDTSIKPGERYSVQFSRSRSGHIITASRDENNNIRLYDPQTNKKVTGTKDINSYFSNQHALSVEFYRVDNLDINESVVNVVTKKAK